jgi:hypothetical protein
VRIPEDVRAQLDIIASLNDRTVTDEIRLAIIDWIDKTKASPDLQQRAASVRGIGARGDRTRGCDQAGRDRGDLRRQAAGRCANRSPRQGVARRGVR